jgi:arsenate reductase-like glutaredoxin family protein
MDLVVDGDNTASKNFVLSSVLKGKVENMIFAAKIVVHFVTIKSEPSSALIINRLINDLDVSSAVNSNKDLVFLHLLGANTSDQKEESPLDQIAPNDAYLMFKLIEEHSKSKTYFPPG